MTPPEAAWVNPFREGGTGERRPEAAAIVVFGATGDLTRRKLLPALFELAADGLLPRPFALTGFARRPWTDAEFRRRMREALRETVSPGRPFDETWREMSPGLGYVSSRFEDRAGYRELGRRLAESRRAGGPRNVLFYLATPPSHYPIIVEMLGRAGLARVPGGWVRIVVEKPFGRDLESARQLNRTLLGVFEEEQIYRIDHYLGKETVQNLLVFRFGNGIFEPLWNRRFVDHVQITVAESIGVAGRGDYFEEAGIMRDMVQNHILQLVSLFAMEPPSSFSPEAVRDEKVKVLAAIRPIGPEAAATDTVRGQYGHGLTGATEVPGYREEPGVSPASLSETYAALKLHIDNWRWAGVPFYIRTGKRLPRRATDIVLEFKSVPHRLFGRSGESLEPNVLTWRVQPEEGVSLQFMSKVPGTSIRIRSVKMDFQYGSSFGQEIHDAYVRLLLDCLAGDSTLFTRRDEIEAAWGFVTGVLESWRALPPPSFPNYEAGTWGPADADAFIAADGRRWRRI